MKVMAGFQMNEEYYVPCTLLEMPWTEGEMVRAVIPQYEMWVQQYMSPDGDHTKAASNLLEHTLPFIAVVTLQDGIYWIKHFPDNSASTILKNTFPDCKAWAAQARKDIIQQQADLEESRMSNMEDATQVAFHIICHDIQQYREEDHQGQEMLEQRLINMTRDCDTYLQLLQQAEHPAVSQRRVSADIPVAPAGTIPRISPTHRHTIHVVPPQCNALTALCSSERIPEIPPSLPTTIHEMLVQHQQAHLVSLELASKKHWPLRVQQTFSKCTYLYHKIRERAQRHQGETENKQMENAALAMDTEKGDMTLNISHT
jgi:hypothetical protein